MKDRKLIYTTLITLILIISIVCVLIISAANSTQPEETTASAVGPAADFTASGTAGTSFFEDDACDQIAANTSTDVKTVHSDTVAESTAEVSTASANVSSDGVIDAAELFTERDLTQNADLTNAVFYTVSDKEDIVITEEGVYVFSGEASHMTIYVEAPEAKVQLVLDGVTITNDNFPCIYVTAADKVFLTSTQDNTLTVSNEFIYDEETDTNTDGVIFSRADLTMNGTGSLTIVSSENGIVTKDDLKVTGGSYDITAASKALEANDSIRICAGTFQISAGSDGLHAENSDDDALGYIYLCGGDFTINAGDDGIHANSVVQIDHGTFYINAAEGIEGTYIQINGGSIAIQASDDGINAGWKSYSYYPTIEINNGDLTIVMGSGDTDGIDSNGDIIVNGGTINVTGNSSFDYDGSAQYNGGTIVVNGQQVNYIPNQMMGGGFGGQNGASGGGRW